MIQEKSMVMSFVHFFCGDSLKSPESKLACWKGGALRVVVST